MISGSINLPVNVLILFSLRIELNSILYLYHSHDLLLSSVVGQLGWLISAPSSLVQL